jgi:hypothetical protein
MKNGDVIYFESDQALAKVQISGLESVSRGLVLPTKKLSNFVSVTGAVYKSNVQENKSWVYETNGVNLAGGNGVLTHVTGTTKKMEPVILFIFNSGLLTIPPVHGDIYIVEFTATDVDGNVYKPAILFEIFNHIKVV